MHCYNIRSNIVAGLSLLVITGLGFLNGCAPKETPSNAPSQAEQKKLKIAGIVFQEDQFFRLIEYGMKDGAKKNNAEILLGNSVSSLDKEISLIDTYIAGKVNAIVISPLSAKGSVDALKRAHDAGIKVVTYNTSIAAEFPVCNIESDQVDLGMATGKAAVEYINKKLNGRANIAMIEFKAQAPEQSAMRVKGFHDEIVKLKGVKIVAEQDAWLAEKATEVVENLLIAHPEINIIWAANEGGTIGAVRAVKNAGKSMKVAVFGTDMSEQLADFLLANDNVLQAVTGQKPFDIGSLAVENAIKAIQGQLVDKNIKLSGIMFTREKPDEVKAYKARLQELSK